MRRMSCGQKLLGAEGWRAEVSGVGGVRGLPHSEDGRSGVHSMGVVQDRVIDEKCQKMVLER